ncbi:MAG: hypothetical protein Q8S39_16220 [Ignavibacteria bacterium]|nr:hypothetical protein [Ignavibacteria bacterium]
MEKVTLFYLERPDIKISMQIYFNEKDQLYFDGYDVGKAVKEIRGETDYEYIYAIEPEEVNKFYKLFSIQDGDKSALLQEIKNRFSVNKAYSLFREFMCENNIKFSSFTWI